MTEADWLAAIRAAPDDDTPRLVFADWLEEAGEGERAELIRAQVEWAGRSPRDPQHSALANRVAALKRPVMRDWVKRLRAAFDRPKARQFRGAICRRGFIEDLDLDAHLPGLFAPAGAELARHPIRMLTLDGQLEHDISESLIELADCPHLTGLEYLWLSGVSEPPSAEAMRRLGSSPHLPRLVALYLGVEIAPRALREVARSPLGRRLTALRVGYGDPEVLRLLTTGRNFAALQLLDLWMYEFVPEDFRLLTDPSLPALHRVRISSSRPLPLDALEDFLDTPRGLRLTELDLTHCKVANRVARRLAGTFGSRGLRRLVLDYGRLSAGGLRALIEAPTWGALEDLSLTGNQVGEKELERLVTSPHLAQLTRLDLGSCGVGEATAQALLARDDLVRLQSLRLYESEFHLGMRRRLRRKFGDAFLFGF